MDKGEIILYKPQGDSITIDVLIENETVWLTQTQMMELFETSQQNISLHINNIIKEGELPFVSTHKDSLLVRKEGDREVQRKIDIKPTELLINV